MPRPIHLHAPEAAEPRRRWASAVGNVHHQLCELSVPAGDLAVVPSPGELEGLHTCVGLGEADLGDANQDIVTLARRLADLETQVRPLVRAECVEVEARSLPQDPSEAVLVDLPERGVVLMLRRGDGVLAGGHSAAIPAEEAQLHARADPRPRVHFACARRCHAGLHEQPHGASDPLLRVRDVLARPDQRSELLHHGQQRELCVLGRAEELGSEGICSTCATVKPRTVTALGWPEALLVDRVAEVHEGRQGLTEAQPLQRQPLRAALLALAPGPTPRFDGRRVLRCQRLGWSQEPFDADALLPGKHHRLDVAAAAVLQGG
mmetsp:Transcript_91209/g.282118  ORF Transcript_91209/g.282118 Transcript_91209/m.282118 type:complete len:320 (-) Transcript_91209:166-1125(-)